MKQLLLITMAAIALLGCKEYESPDGRIPQEYVTQAQALVGDYNGEFNNVRGTLQLRIVDGNKPQASFVTASGKVDLFDGDCNAEIGDLKTVSLKEKNGKYEVSGMSFALDTKLCVSIMGETLDLRLKRKNGGVRVDAQVLYEERFDDSPCFDDIRCPGLGTISTYYKGEFIK